MEFFIPDVNPAEATQTHADLIKQLHDQFRLPILDRRIYKLEYTNSKKRWVAEVGCMEQQSGRYKIIAIFEAKEFIIVTRDRNDHPGITILVDKTEVTTITDF